MVKKYNNTKATTRAAAMAAGVVLALMNCIVKDVEAADLLLTKIYLENELCEGTPDILTWDGVTGFCLHTNVDSVMYGNCTSIQFYESMDCSGIPVSEEVFDHECEIYLAGRSRRAECLSVPDYRVGAIQFGDSCSEDGSEIFETMAQTMFMLDVCRQDHSQYTMYTLTENETSINQIYSTNPDCSDPEQVLTFPIGLCEIRNDLRNIVGDIAVKVVPAVEGATLSQTPRPTGAPTPIANGMDAILRKSYQESETCSSDPTYVSFLGLTNRCIQTSGTKSVFYNCTSSQTFNSIDCTGTPVVEEFEEECGTFVSSYSSVSECVVVPGHQFGFMQIGETCTEQGGINFDGQIPFLLDFCQRAEHQYIMFKLSEDETSVDQSYSLHPDCSDPEVLLTFPVGPCEIRGDLPHAFADYAVRIIPAVEGGTLSRTPPVTNSPTTSPTKSPTDIATQQPTAGPSSPGTDGSSNAVIGSSVSVLTIGVAVTASILAAIF